MKKKSIGLFIVLSFLSLFLLAPVSSHAAAMEIRASHDSTTDSPWHLGMVRFSELVEKKSNGAVKIKIFPPGQLSQSNIRTTIELLQSGSLQCALVIPAFYEAFDKRFMVYGMPFLFKDRAKTYEVLDGPLGRKMLGLFEEKGLKGLSHWDHGYRQLTNSKRDIRTVEDLQGLRIRTPLSPVIGSIFKTLGATTTATSMGELYMALQQKVVDGQENPYNTIYRRKFYEVQEYITEWNYQWSPLMIAMNLQFFRGLSPENQKILLSAADEAAVYQRKISSDEDEKMKKDLVTKGMKLTVLDKNELDKFQKAMKPVYETFEPQIGKDLLQEFIQALN